MPCRVTIKTHGTDCAIRRCFLPKMAGFSRRMAGMRYASAIAMRKPTRGRKLLIASVGVATINYVAACGGESHTSGGQGGEAHAGTGGLTSGNLVPPPPAGAGGALTSGNLVPPPVAGTGGALTSGNLVPPPVAGAGGAASAGAGGVGTAGTVGTAGNGVSGSAGRAGAGHGGSAGLTSGNLVPPPIAGAGGSGGGSGGKGGVGGTSGSGGSGGNTGGVAGQ